MFAGEHNGPILTPGEIHNKHLQVENWTRLRRGWVVTHYSGLISNHFVKYFKKSHRVIHRYPSCCGQNRSVNNVVEPPSVVVVSTDLELFTTCWITAGLALL